MNWTNSIPDREAADDLLGDLLGVAVRRKLLILAVLVATALGCYVALSFITEQYEAEARLLVKLGRENTEVPLTVEKGGVYATGVAKEEINSNIQLLTARSLMEETVDRLGIERFTFEAPRPPGLLAGLKYFARQTYRYVRDRWSDVLIALDLQKRVDVREAAVSLLADRTVAARERDSNVTVVKIRLPDPRLALDALNELLELYRQHHVDVQRQGNLRGMFEEQATQLGAELDSLQAEIVGLKQRANLSSAPEQRSQFLQRLDLLRRGIDERTKDLRQVTSEKATLQKRVVALPANVKSQEVVEPNRGSRSIRDRLVQLRLRRIETVGRYSDDAQIVKNIDEEIATLEQVLTREAQTETGEVTYQPNPVAQQFQLDIERADVRVAGLTAAIEEERRQITDIEAQLRALDAGDDSLRVAELRRKVLEEKFLAASERSSSARIAQGYDERELVNMAVLGKPSVPQVPVYPPKLLIMGIGIVAGLLLGFALALALEWRSDIIRTPRDLEGVTGVPVLGVFTPASPTLEQAS